MHDLSTLTGLSLPTASFLFSACKTSLPIHSRNACQGHIRRDVCTPETASNTKRGIVSSRLRHFRETQISNCNPTSAHRPLCPLLWLRSWVLAITLTFLSETYPPPGRAQTFNNLAVHLWAPWVAHFVATPGNWDSAGGTNCQAASRGHL